MEPQSPPDRTHLLSTFDSSRDRAVLCILLMFVSLGLCLPLFFSTFRSMPVWASMSRSKEGSCHSGCSVCNTMLVSSVSRKPLAYWLRKDYSHHTKHIDTGSLAQRMQSDSLRFHSGLCYRIPRTHVFGVNSRFVLQFCRRY